MGTAIAIVLNELNKTDKKILLNSQILSNTPDDKVMSIDNYIMLDTTRFLVSTNKETIYRHSTKSAFYYVDLKNNKVVSLMNRQKIMYPAVSPDGSKVAFVFENDLYFTDLLTQKNVQLTTDGQFNHIINGAADWVYEEEFVLTSAFKWSPDSKYIAYLKFNESEVKGFGIDMYYGNYPERETYKYPRAGEKNSEVSVWIAGIKKKKSSQIPIQAEYIPRIKWRGADELGIMTLNRFQNELNIHLYQLKTKALSNLYHEEDKKYIDLPLCFEFMPDGELAISSEKTGWQQLYILDKQGENLYATNCPFEIESIKQINMTDKKVYLRIYGPSIERTSVIHWNLTDNTYKYVTDTNGIADIKMLGTQYYMETFNNQYTRNRISIKNVNNTNVYSLLEDYRTEDSILGRKTFFEIPLDGRTLSAWKIHPPNFDSTKKYPVLFFVYGGPGDQRVQNVYPRQQTQWLHYISQLGYIIVCVDNRGTAGKGTDFKKSTYMRLGQQETEDQMAAARHIGQWSYVDSSRIGIFGWSYGGYMSLMTIVQENSPFKAAISVAPVTQWRYYDAVYSERYMRTPVANHGGYEKSSPMYYVNNLKGDLLLIHGMADDNVHFQHSLEMIKSLNEAGKQYRFLAYPNKDHGIGGTKTKMHLYQAMTDFILEKL
jgi:dipeptidyl-peptidase 4